MTRHAMKRHSESGRRAPAPAAAVDLADMVAAEPAAEWLTDADVSRIYKIPRGTLRYYRSKGGGPPYRRLSPAVVRYLGSELEAWLDSKAVRPEQAAERSAS